MKKVRVLSAEEAAALGCAEGLQTLDGAQTMAYMRLPDAADAARSHQYKAVMQLLYQGTRDKNPFALMGLARKLMSTMTTNMGLMDMISLATTVMGVMSGCAFVRVHDVRENKRVIQMTEAILGK